MLLYGNISGYDGGKPLPRLVPYNGLPAILSTLDPLAASRIIFTCPPYTGGFRVEWDGHTHGGVFPLLSGEIAPAMDPPFSGGFPYTASVSLSKIRIDGTVGDFLDENNHRWLMKGFTEMTLPARLRRGEDVSVLFRQRQDAGANTLRMLGMGYPFQSNPPVDQQPVSMGIVAECCQRAAEYGMQVLWCTFAGTAQVPGADNQSWQLGYWDQTNAELIKHPNAWAMVCNEWNHSTQRIDPRIFPQHAGILSSRGNSLTDETPAKPAMDVEFYSARRDTDNARGFTNMDPFEFESGYPTRPKIACEGAKPVDYGFNLDFATKIGRHGSAGWGTFAHTDAGVRSELMDGNTMNCVRVIFENIK